MNKKIEEAAACYGARYAKYMDGNTRSANVSALKATYIDGANFALTQQWRSVEDELPEDGQTVLVSTMGADIAVMFWSEQKQLWVETKDNNHTYCKDYIVCYMPIPSLNPELLKTGKETALNKHK